MLRSAPKSRPFASLLPHGLILDDKDGWILLSTPRPWGQTLTLGCAWEVQPRTIEACPEGLCLEMAQAHASLLRGLPAGAALQVILALDPAHQASEWEALREGLDSPVVTAQRQAIRQGCPYGQGRAAHHLRAARTLVTLRFPLGKPAFRLGEVTQALKMGGAEESATLLEVLRRHLAEPLRAALGYRTGVADSLEQAGHQVAVLSGQEVGAALMQACRPSLTAFPAVQAHLEVREQILTTQATSHAWGWEFGQGAPAYGARVLTMHRAPVQTYPGILSAPRAPEGAEPLSLWQAWQGPLRVVVNLVALDQGQQLAMLKRRRHVAFVHRFNLFKGTNPENEQVEQELRALIANAFKSLEHLYLARVHLVPYGPVEHLHRGCESLQRTASRFGMELLEEETLGGTLFLQTLPLGFDPTWPQESFLRRGRHLPGAHVANLLPLYGGTRGNGEPHALYLNRRGETVAFSPFAGGRTRHMVISGVIGAGKSYAMAHFINQVLPLGAYVVLLDQLPSYKELCTAWGGRYVEMDFNQPTTFNPFYGPLDQEHQAFLTAALAEMAGGTVDPISREQLGVLSDAVGYFLSTWERERGEPTLSLFNAEVLTTGHFSPQDRRAQRLAMDLSRRLRMFYGTGHLAGFVDGPNTFRIDRHLTVVELSKINESHELQGVIMFALMHLIAQFFQDPRLIEVPKYFGADETWALLKNQETAAAIETLARTYRKLNTAAIFLSQQVTDFNSPAGEVIRKNAELKLFLQQDPEEIHAMRDLFDLTAAEVAMIRQARRGPGWSSAYLKLPDHAGGLIHLVPDAATDWLAGQSPQHRARRAEALAGTDGDLMRAFAATLPQGPDDA